MDWKLAASKNPGEMMTDMPYALYAEGIFKALEGIGVLDIPIYITETGVADSGDAVRPVMIQTYMSAIEQAIRAGHDIRGVLYWSLVDNFEWAFGYTMKFGIYEWDASSQQRTCRQSGRLLKHWFKRLQQRGQTLSLSS
jgi:beta-glucosidase/6-phospho-beta-glucosidase/beta-galactosidase